MNKRKISTRKIISARSLFSLIKTSGKLEKQLETLIHIIKKQVQINYRIYERNDK